jgi:hypothetical protein
VLSSDAAALTEEELILHLESSFDSQDELFEEGAAWDLLASGQRLGQVRALSRRRLLLEALLYQWDAASSPSVVDGALGSFLRLAPSRMLAQAHFLALDIQQGQLFLRQILGYSSFPQVASEVVAFVRETKFFLSNRERLSDWKRREREPAYLLRG